MNELDSCVCFNTRKLARCVSQMYDTALEPSGLKNTQFALLAMVSVREPISITELADAMGIERTTLTRNLKVLVRDGLLAVMQGADARSRAVTITTAGRSRVKTAFPLWAEAQERLVKRIGKRRWMTLKTELEALCEATAGD